MMNKGKWRVTITAYIAVDNPYILEDLILCRMRKDETDEEVISAMDDDFEVLYYPDNWLDFEEIIE